MGSIAIYVLHIAMMFKVWWDPIILKQMLNHDKNYTELCIENYFPEKNHSTLSKQLTNILIKFCFSKTFKIKHKNRKQV